MLDQALGGANRAAWRADTFTSPADYSLALTDSERAAMRATAASLAAAGQLAPAEALTRADFAWGPLGARLAAAYRELRDGRGFVVIRGLPREGITLAEFTAIVWGIGAHFGRPLSQNAAGELITHVVDASAEDATPRMYRSNLELRLHSDITAMIALACWNQGVEGGANILASAATIHGAIAAPAPHLLERLYRGYHYHRIGEEGEGEEPVTPYRVPVFVKRGGTISCRYQRTSIVGGHKALGVPLDGDDIAALDLFDATARAPEHRIAFTQERGDMVVINNYAVLHARTRFADHPEPERKRRLVRLWLDAPGFRDLPGEINLFAVNGIPPQPGRKCTFDFKQLYADEPQATGGMPHLVLDPAAARKAP